MRRIAIISTMARMTIGSAAARAFMGAALALGLSTAALAQPAAEGPPAAGPDAAQNLGQGPDETREEALERLHAALAATTGEEGGRIAQEIQTLWSRSGSDSMDLLLNRGRNALEREDFEAARAHLAAVTRLAPDFTEGWNAFATLHYLQQDYGTAVDMIQRVLAIEPRHFSALTGLALSLEVVGRKDAALKTWREVEALYPSLENAQKAIKRLAPEVDGRTL